MIRKIFFLLGVFAIFNLKPAVAGYGELKSDFDGYQPPGFFENQLRAIPEAEVPEDDGTFAAEKKRIDALQSKWEAALSGPPAETGFLHMDPAVIDGLRPAESDMTKAAGVLKKRFSLQQIEGLTLLRNPKIKAAENRFRAAIEAFTQVTALDEILREYTSFSSGMMVELGPVKGKDPVAMKFPFPGLMALKGEIVDQEVRAKKETLESVLRDTITEIRMAFWNLAYIVKAQDITAEMVALLNYLESVANTRYESGKANYQDVIKVRINRETLEENLITLKEKQRNFESIIRKVLDLSPAIELGTPAWRYLTASPPDLEHLYAKAQKHRQELQRIRAIIAGMAYMVEMAETMIMPPYTLNLSLYPNAPIRSVGSSAKGDSFPVTTRASRGAGLPQKPWYGIEDAYIREMRHNLSARKEDLKSAEAETYTLIRNGWFELDRARREVTLYQDQVVKLARSALDVSTRGYESGNVAFADVIDSYTRWLNSNLLLARNQSDLGMAWARLEQVVGISLR